MLQIKCNSTPHPLDPNHLEFPDQHEHRIYGSADLEIYAVVDWIDYIYFTQWSWSVHATKDKKKLYLRRGVSEFWDSDGEKYESPTTGRLVRNRRRRQFNLFLHQAIMVRAEIPRPTPAHKLVDHMDRDTMNCRRYNLQWATHKMNGANRLMHGRTPNSMI